MTKTFLYLVKVWAFYALWLPPTYRTSFLLLTGSTILVVLACVSIMLAIMLFLLPT